MTELSLSNKSEARKNRRIERQKKTIMDAAAHLFTQNGFAKTSIKDIADSVDLGESTLYGYFPSKHDILLSILNQKIETVDSLLANMGDLHDHESFVNLVDGLLESVLSSLAYYRVVLAEAWLNDEILKVYVIDRWKPILDDLRNFISRKTSDGVFRPVDIELAVRMIFAMFIGAMLPVLRGIQPPPSLQQRRDMAVGMVDFLYYGLSSRKG